MVEKFEMTHEELEDDTIRKDERITKAMPQDVQQHQEQPFKQIMDTIFTCRSLLKYNLALSEEQKNDLLADIDTSLRILQTQLAGGTSIDARITQESAATSLEKENNLSPEHEQSTLRALYKMYHSYMDAGPGGGTSSMSSSTISTFVARFNDAIAVIDEVQGVVEKSYGKYDVYHQQLPIQEPLHRIKDFVADLYYSFMEFVRTLSDVLQQNEVQLDTEKLSSMQNSDNPEEEKLKKQNLTPLLQIYEAHLQLNERKGGIMSRVNDMTAFLEFLKESFDDNFNKRDEFILQLNLVIRLLFDLSRLLSDYEHAAAQVLS